MLLQAIACFYWLLHAFTGYCMLLQAIACFYWLLHAFTGYCMLLQSIAGFCMLCSSCLYACFCIYLPDQTVVYTCIIDIQFCNVFVLNNILRQNFFLEWTNFLEPWQFRQYMTIRTHKKKLVFLSTMSQKKKLNHLTIVGITRKMVPIKKRASSFPIIVCHPRYFGSHFCSNMF